MKFIKSMVLILCLSAGVYKTTPADLQTPDNNSTSISNGKENKTVIELNKDITVNTGLNLDKTLAQLNGTEASYIPKIRKVTPVDNDSLERRLKADIKVNNKNITQVNASTTTTTAPAHVTKILTEGGEINLKESAKNASDINKEASKDDNDKAIVVTESTTNKGNNNNKTEATSENSKIDKPTNSQQDKSTNTTITTMLPIDITNKTVTTAAPLLSSTTATINVITPNTTNTAANPSNNSSSTSTTTTTTTPTSTTTTTTTTTPKPKKPTITYSIPDFPDLEKNNPELKNLLQSSSSSKLPLPDGPYAQPSQEFNNNSFHHGRDLILPIVSMIFIIPLVIGILITSYRRFRDCWSTRHYRRMDFLVDGMYND